MMRLFDLLASHDPDWPTHTQMPIIVADDIAAEIDKMQDDMPSPSAESYGCVAPPFDLFFVEARTKLGRMEVLRGVAITAFTDNNFNKLFIGDRENVHWQLGIGGYIHTQQLGLRGYNGFAIVNLDKDGYLLEDMDKIQAGTPNHDEFKQPGLLPVEQMMGNIVFALKAISMMHQRCEAKLVTPTRQQRRKAQRKDDIKLHPYYYLKVKPVTKKYESNGRSGRKKAEHSVRGHFRYYTEERPLFGRVSGMVWIPDHKRGDGGLGQIDKGYRV